MSIAILPEPEAKPSARSAANGREYSLRPDDILYEIVDGQRVEMPPMSIFAVWLGTRLSKLLANFVDPGKLGTVVTEGLFILDRQKRTHRRPDVAFVSDRTWPVDRPLPEAGDWEVIPDVAVEAISPTELFEEAIGKILEYFHYGVKQVWVIVPTHRMVYVYSSPTEIRVLTAEQELADTVVPGFRLKLADLFPEHGKV